jgi:hypothetical protein
VLRPGARFALDTTLAAESLLPALPRHMSLRARDAEVWIEQAYAVEESGLDVRYVFVHNDQHATWGAVRHVYTEAEIGRLLASVGFYEKGSDFVSGADPIVRVDARRLRDKLREYYASAPHDAVIISVPKGGYTPTWQNRCPRISSQSWSR